MKLAGLTSYGLAAALIGGLALGLAAPASADTCEERIAEVREMADTYD